MDLEKYLLLKIIFIFQYKTTRKGKVELLMRGTLVISGETWTSLRITPAYAGNTQKFAFEHVLN